jgi:hypothetical protein
LAARARQRGGGAAVGLTSGQGVSRLPVTRPGA